MIKNIYISFFILFFPASALQVFGQRALIDSLKNALPLLNDTARVNCLIALSFSYSYQNIDSANYYSEKGLQEAKILHYTSGMIRAMNNKAMIAGHADHDFSLQEKISHEIISQFAEENHQKLFQDTYLNLALSLFFQNKYEASREICLKLIKSSRSTPGQKARGEAMAILGAINFEQARYNDAFEYFNQSLAVFKTISDSYNTAIVLAKIGDLYRLAGDEASALNFYLQSLRYEKGPSLKWYPLEDLGDTYYLMEPDDPEPDNNDTYIQSIKNLTIHSNYFRLSKLRLAETEIASKAFNDAIPILLGILKDIEKRNDKNLTMRVLLDLSISYDGASDPPRAITFADRLLSLAKANQANQYMRDSYKLLYRANDNLGNIRKAYTYLQLYTAMKDSIALETFSQKLALYSAAIETQKKETQIELLNRQNTINEQKLQLREQELKATSFFRNALIAGVALIIMVGLIFYRNIALKQKNEMHRREIAEKGLMVQMLESERIKTEWLQQTTKLEMQALRAQMNPHFIFNSLNSVNRFILQNNKFEASEYLTKFSNLMRAILENSEQSLITLKTELDNLELYLELERLRFNFHFEFEININKDIDLEGIKVPPLIIQPFVENSIWHGIMHKEENGHLKIDLYQEDELLLCRITDNGIGRKKSSELQNKNLTHQSMGMRITADRIARVQSNKKYESHVTTRDLVFPDGTACGTEVILKIPIVYD